MQLHPLTEAESESETEGGGAGAGFADDVDAAISTLATTTHDSISNVLTDTRVSVRQRLFLQGGELG